MEATLADVKDIHIRVTDEVHRKLKVKAAANDKSITNHVQSLVESDVAHVKIPKDWFEEAKK